MLITGTLTFLAGLWVLTPWYLPLVAPAASTALGVSVLIGGFLNSLASLPALWVFRRDCPKAVARGAFWLFFWYSFVTLTRIILTNGVSLGWVASLIIALIMAVVYVEQKAVAASPIVIIESTD